MTAAELVEHLGVYAGAFNDAVRQGLTRPAYAERMAYCEAVADRAITAMEDEGIRPRRGMPTCRELVTTALNAGSALRL